MQRLSFFAVNGEAGGEQALCVDDLVVKHYSSHVYLASPFTCDGSTSAKEHATEKLC